MGPVQDGVESITPEKSLKFKTCNSYSTMPVKRLSNRAQPDDKVSEIVGFPYSGTADSNKVIPYTIPDIFQLINWILNINKKVN